jgi:hypothetical protein
MFLFLLTGDLFFSIQFVLNALFMSLVKALSRQNATAVSQ